MAWEEIRPIMVGKRSTQPSVSVAWRQYGKGEKGYRFVVSVNGPLMKLFGWKQGTNLLVKVNHQARLMRITETSATGFIIQQKHTNTGYVGVRLDGVKITGAKIATVTGHHVDGKSLVIQLPKWAVREGTEFASQPALPAPISAAPSQHRSIMDRVPDPVASLRGRA